MLIKIPLLKLGRVFIHSYYAVLEQEQVWHQKFVHNWLLILEL